MALFSHRPRKVKRKWLMHVFPHFFAGLLVVTLLELSSNLGKIYCLSTAHSPTKFLLFAIIVKKQRICVAAQRKPLVITLESRERLHGSMLRAPHRKHL